MADAEGYRQTDDAGGSSEVLRSIIFNKLPLLNSPGELIPNTLYYDAANSSVQAAEQTNFFGRDRIAFNNKNFGSTPSVHIPNVFFTNTCFVIAELEYQTATWTNAASDDKFYMPAGWGFHCIDNIVYYLGSSSVANIQISGLANMIFHLSSCETDGKRNALLNGAGSILAPQANATGRHKHLWSTQAKNHGRGMAHAATSQFLFRNAANANPIWDDGMTQWVQVNYLAPELALAVIPIRLPFSSVCALEKRISFDTKLLQQPIQVTLSLRAGSDIMEVGASALSTPGNLQTAFRSLSFQSFQQGLSDQSLSLRNELLANPRFSVGVPFQYLQDMRFNVLTSQGTGEFDGMSGTYFVNITSMLNADLTTIQFALTWDQDQKPSGTNRFAPFKFIEMRNIQLLLNGQRLHNYDSTSYPMVYLANVLDSYWANVIVAPYAPADSKDTLKRLHLDDLSCPIYEINFSRLRAVAREAHMMNTPRFTNQTMQLAFDISLSYPNFSPSQWDTSANKTKNPNLVLQTSYLYNAVFMVGQDGGQSKLVTA